MKSEHRTLLFCLGLLVSPALSGASDRLGDPTGLMLPVGLVAALGLYAWLGKAEPADPGPPADPAS